MQKIQRQNGPSREIVDLDYRFVGIGLCTLAALLLHALGWLGQE